MNFLVKFIDTIPTTDPATPGLIPSIMNGNVIKLMQAFRGILEDLSRVKTDACLHMMYTLLQGFGEEMA